MHGWTHPVPSVLEKVHEVCDRVGVGLHLHILDEPIESDLSVEFCEGDGVLWACAGAGAAGWWSGVVRRWSGVLCCWSRGKVVANGWGLCMYWRVERRQMGCLKSDCGWWLSEAERTRRIGSQRLGLQRLMKPPTHEGRGPGVVSGIPSVRIELGGFSRRAQCGRE